jgi:LmbE family N-acetylglucosaminyl deacetylase
MAQVTKLTVNSELINHIEHFITRADPDLVLTHSPGDLHHDHRAIAAATLEAGRFTTNILSYEIPLTKNFSPQVYYDISKLYLKSNAIKGLAEYRALQSRLNTSINYVEAFEVHKLCFGQEFRLFKVPQESLVKYQKSTITPNGILEFV